MKSLRLFLPLAMGVVLLTLAARPLASALAAAAGPRFLPILCTALVGAILLLDLARALGERHAPRLPVVVLAGAVVLFILASRPPAHLQLPVVGCFCLGTVLGLTGRRQRAVGDLALLVLVSLLAASTVWLHPGARFLPMDAWVYLLAALAGYSAVPGRR